MKPQNFYMESLKSLVLKEFASEDVRVILFGSRARGDAHPGSDADLALVPGKNFSLIKLSNLREKIDDSNIPFRVDIVNTHEISPEFQNQIKKDGIVWKDFN